MWQRNENPHRHRLGDVPPLSILQPAPRGYISRLERYQTGLTHDTDPTTGPNRGPAHRP